MSGRSYSARTVPVLHALLCDLGEMATRKDAKPGDAQVVRLAQEELHLVLAVVKAAPNGHACGAGAKPKACALCRALGRLKKERP